MSKKIIVRIAEGIGNQLFMYAHAYSLSKNINYDLFIDNTSGYFKKKNQVRSYQLDKFNIDTSLSKKNYRFVTLSLNIKRNILKKLDFFKKKKLFLLERTFDNKITQYIDTDMNNFSDLLYIEGYFESEKYFKKFKNKLKSKFIIKDKYLDQNNKFIELLKNNNSVSISVRQNRYSERGIVDNDKSLKFTKNTIDYIYKAISFFKKKIPNPRFFIWSNDFKNLNNYFNKNEFTFIENQNNKSLNDFNLFRYSKHFIVGPTSFHRWGAWLNETPDKICVRPSNINPSNNKDFWPDAWIKI